MAAKPTPLSALTSGLSKTPRTLTEMVEKYSAIAAVLGAFDATVSGKTLAAAVVADLRAVQSAGDDDMVTQTEAAAETGLSKRTLVRQAKAGKILSTGANRSRRYRRGDLRAKPGYAPPRPATGGAATASHSGVVSAAPTAHDLMTDARRVAELARKGGKSA